MFVFSLSLFYFILLLYVVVVGVFDQISKMLKFGSRGFQKLKGRSWIVEFETQKNTK